jgi:FlaA1/EpsC-like NDP-sugar epimerase
MQYIPVKINTNMIKSLNIVPRFIIFFLDLICVAFALWWAIVMRFNFNFTGIDWYIAYRTLLLVTVIFALVFFSIKTYAGIVRYTGTMDAFRIATAVIFSTSILALIGFLSIQKVSDLYLHYSILILLATFSFFFLIIYRVAVKYVFSYLRSIRMTKKNVIIYGAAETGVATKRVLDHDGQNNIRVLAFIDDNSKKQNKVLDGVSIYPFHQLSNLVETQEVDEIIIASFSITTQRKNELVDFCLNHDIKVLNVPSYKNWSDGSFSSKQLRTINIEELLERDPISINNNQIRDQIKGKRILVTGAAGSIGSEIVRQLCNHYPELIVLCDQAETPLHHLQLEIAESGTRVNCVPYLASITNEKRMKDLFEQFKPQIVYHAAAYKHVPMMELCPTEAVKNNSIGTRVIADLSVEYGVERFVMVSTDKAVNPTNVMGASKRLAEIYVQGLSKSGTNLTRFITTRFGNVLGSNGSVINRFKEQIERGGPVTVTHPNITRYFMTIPEACQLVLEAGSMGHGGEIFVFDMGRSVTISDLAKKMIRLYGFIPNIDIEIKYTGLRPGEKLYEELLNDGENTAHTYHEKIMIAKVRDVEFDYVKSNFDILAGLVSGAATEMHLVAKMKELVPEFLSNNSDFEKLDTKVKFVSFR